MTPSDEQVRNAVAQQAGAWFIANQPGRLQQAERAAFMAWLKASPIHVEEYLGVALVAHDLPAALDEPDLTLEALVELARADDTDGLVSIDSALPVRDLPSKRVSKPPIWSLAGATAIATVMLVLAASALWWLHDGELLGLPKSYETAHGERLVAQLPDGSVLDLNTDTAVTVRYTRSERVVEIAGGQALFTIARDDRRRFRVAAGEVHVVAVGTRFDCYRRTDAATVTVVEGSVAVFAGQPPRVAMGFPPDALRVNAGYRVNVDGRGVLDQPFPVDVQQAVAWMQGKIAFAQRPLGEVADEFNRYGPIPIEIDDTALRALPISGVFDAYDVDSFVAFLQTLDGVRVERTTARIRVFSLKSQKE